MSKRAVVLSTIIFLFGFSLYLAGSYLGDPHLSGLGGSLMGCGLTAAFYEYEKGHLK